MKSQSQGREVLDTLTNLAGNKDVEIHKAREHRRQRARKVHVQHIHSNSLRPDDPLYVDRGGSGIDRVRGIVEQVEREHRSGSLARKFKREAAAAARKRASQARLTGLDRQLMSENDDPPMVKPVRPLSTKGVSCVAKGSGGTNDKRFTMSPDIEERGPAPLGFDQKTVKSSVRSESHSAWYEYCILKHAAKENKLASFEAHMFLTETTELSLYSLTDVMQASDRKEMIGRIHTHYVNYQKTKR